MKASASAAGVAAPPARFTLSTTSTGPSARASSFGVTASAGEAAEAALAAFEERWDERFTMISRTWRRNWSNLTRLFDDQREIRKVMDTANGVEAMNPQLRKVTKKRGAFPGPEPVRKVLYLAIMKASERWTRPVED